MIDFLNIEERFDNYKDELLELLINYYGQEYRELITDRFEKIHFDFLSTPLEYHDYLENNKDNIDEGNQSLIENYYEDYTKIQNEITKVSNKQLLNYIKNSLSIKKVKKKEALSFLSLFASEEYGMALIDSFSTNSIKLLEDPKTSKSVVDKIKHGQKVFMDCISFLGFSIDKPKTVISDNIICYRDILRERYTASLIEKTKFCQEYRQRIRETYDYAASMINLEHIIFAENPWAGNIVTRDKTGLHVYSFIKMPFVKLVNSNINMLDNVIIHEIIHKIETKEEIVGIHNHNLHENEIVNEVRTQIISIEIANELHNKGIFIFDNPNDYVINGKISYERLFPLIKDFLDKYEKEISDCAINSNPDRLKYIFGDSWIEFSKAIDELYLKHMCSYSMTRNIIPFDNNNEYIRGLISDMENYEQYGFIKRKS